MDLCGRCRIDIEYFEDIPKAKAALKGFRKLDWIPYHGTDGQKNRWNFNRHNIIAVAATVGTILVTVGVAGELYVDAISGRIEHALRSDTDLTIASLQKEAKEADARAQAEALARLEFEKEFGPRTLTENQERRLIGDWHKYANRVVTLERINDVEAITFARQLEYVLSKAGLKVNEVEFPLTGKFVLGVTVDGSMNDSAMWDIADSLNCVGIVSNPFSTTCDVPSAPPPIGSPDCGLEIDIGFNTIGEQWKDSAKQWCRNRQFLP